MKTILNSPDSEKLVAQLNRIGEKAVAKLGLEKNFGHILAVTICREAFFKTMRMMGTTEYKRRRRLLADFRRLLKCNLEKEMYKFRKYKNA